MEPLKLHPTYETTRNTFVCLFLIRKQFIYICIFFNPHYLHLLLSHIFLEAAEDEGCGAGTAGGYFSILTLLFVLV